jgi:FixJ family two-component response regulator
MVNVDLKKDERCREQKWRAQQRKTARGLTEELSMSESPAVPVIAVVDDDESVRESLASLVESVGYEVALFGSAEEFLKLARYRDDFDCLILDMRLPGLSGFELHTQLTAAGWFVPTIFITAHADRVLAREPGVLTVLYKPFQPEVLLESVRIAITQSRRFADPT